MFRFTRSFSTSLSRADVSRMTLLGRIATPLEKSVSKSGNEYMKYALVVNHNREKASFFNITVFDPTLQDFMTKYVEKGNLVYVEADASINKYEVEGQNRSSLSLVQQSISPVTWAKRNEQEGEEAQE